MADQNSADVYGFKDRNVAISLRDLVRRGPLSTHEPSANDANRILVESSRFAQAKRRYTHTFIGTITEEVTAVTAGGEALPLTIPELDDLTIDELVNGLSATEGYILGKGKAIILRRLDETDANLEIQQILMQGSPPETHEIVVYNYTDQVIPVTTGSGQLTEDTVIHIIAQDNFGDHYIIPNQKGDPGQPGPPGVSGDTIFYEFVEHMPKSDMDAFVKALNPDGTDFAGAINFEFEVADEAARLALVEGAGAGEVEVNDIIAQTGPGYRTFWRFDGDAGGNDPSDPTQWTSIPSDQHYIVLDPTQYIEASADYDTPDGTFSYTPGSVVRGFLGTGGIANENLNDEGFSTLHIHRVQSFAAIIEVVLWEDIIDNTQAYKARYVRSHGTNHWQKPPKQVVFDNGTNPDTYGVYVKNTSGAALGADGGTDPDLVPGESWIAVLNASTREYELLTPVKDFKLVTGTAKTQLLGDTGTVTVEGITNVNGPNPVLPGRDLEGDTAVPVYIEIGDTVDLYRDNSFTSIESDKWRITSQFDLTPFLKGYPDFDPAENLMVLSSVLGTLKWKIPAVSSQKPFLIVQLTEDTQDPSTTVVLKDMYDTTDVALLPVALEANMEVFNTMGWGDNGKEDEIWLVAWSQDSAQWELLHPITSGMQVAITTSTIPALSSLTNTLASFQTGTATLCDQDATTFTTNGTTVTVINLTKTDLRASVEEPVVLILHKFQDKYVILNHIDPRGFPGFDATKPQIMVHDEGASDFYLYDFCFDSDFITSVEVEVNSLVYKYPDPAHASGACELVTVNIIDIGPCDP